MRRKIWHIVRVPLFLFLFCSLIPLTLHATTSAAASSAAEPEVAEVAIDTSAAAGDLNASQSHLGAAPTEADPAQEVLLHAHEDVFSVSREEGADLSEGMQEDHQPGSSAASSVVRNVVSLFLTAIIVSLSLRIIWDVMNFVGDVPDPFAHVQTPEEIPQAIEELLDENVPLAFVIR
ncbi:hypothetical protein ACSSS7_001898 [Eimeria intestinalis]